MISKIIIICNEENFNNVLQIQKENTYDIFTVKGKWNEANKVWKFIFYIDINHHSTTIIKLKFSHCHIDHEVRIDIDKEIYKHKFIYTLNYYDEQDYDGERNIYFYISDEMY